MKYCTGNPRKFIQKKKERPKVNNILEKILGLPGKALPTREMRNWGSCCPGWVKKLSRFVNENFSQNILRGLEH